MAAVDGPSARVPGYRPRRSRPAVLLAVILSTVAGLVWFSVLHQTTDNCPAPATPSQRLPADGLDGVVPEPPQFIRVDVLNAGGVRGEAIVVDGALAQLGFAPTTPANDPQYPAFDLHCYGEIRFGAAGQAGARTLSLALPCAELVRDNRPDAHVDLALGTKFIALGPNDAARTALRELAKLGQPVPAGPSRGGLAAQIGPPSITQPPVVNPDLLRRARQVTC